MKMSDTITEACHRIQDGMDSHHPFVPETVERIAIIIGELWGTQFQWNDAHNKAPERLTAEDAKEAYRKFLHEREQAQLQEAIKRGEIGKDIKVVWDEAEK